MPDAGQPGDDDEPVARERDVMSLRLCSRAPRTTSCVLGHVAKCTGTRCRWNRCSVSGGHAPARSAAYRCSYAVARRMTDPRRPRSPSSSRPAATTAVPSAWSSARDRARPRSVAGRAIARALDLHVGARHAKAAMLADRPGAAGRAAPRSAAGVWPAPSRRRLAAPTGGRRGGLRRSAASSVDRGSPRASRSARSRSPAHDQLVTLDDRSHRDGGAGTASCQTEADGSVSVSSDPSEAVADDAGRLLRLRRG